MSRLEPHARPTSQAACRLHPCPAWQPTAARVLSRSIERTDLYLTVGPEPLAVEEAHPHPQGERLKPEQLLARVMTRDGSKTLAGDTPTAVDVRRLSTRQLRDRREELAALRASCPPDRSRELQRARERATGLEAARQAAQAEHQAAIAALAQVQGRWHRREQAVARDRVTLAGHALRTVTGQAEQAAELAGWACTAGWRAAAIAAAGVTAAVLLWAAGLDRLALPVGLAAALAVGWRLRFRVSREACAWRDGARGERATARLLRRLGRHGWVVFHDLGIPGTPANADHLLIGPPGVIVIDSKRYTGQVTQDPDGRVWHNHYPMDHTLRSLRLEAQAISAALGVHGRAMMCVHHARVADGGLMAGEVEILPARRLPSMLRNRRHQLGEADVALLVTHALSVLRPAG